MRTFRNPVLPGSYPDPSICRVGGDYYLVTSSFAYYPGIPLFHSRDLVRWRQLTHLLNRPGQLPLEGLDVSDGVWAPTIRHHDGTFYVVSTLARNRRGSLTFVVTADDPAGPWSDPIPLEADGIDPSLFFDDDGRCWFTACRDAITGGPGEVWLRELDTDRLKLIGPTQVLWHGAVRGAWVEGPHLYKHDGRYYLIAAEGGTESNHSVTAAHSDAVTGPYLTDPRSPLLTHRHRGPDEPIHNVGHADLVETQDGEMWAVTLGVRPVDGTHTLGREVFLVPVTWGAHGPVFAPESGGVRVLERLPSIASGHPDADPVPGLEWNSLRGPVDDRVRPSAGGGLDIDLAPEPLSSTGVPAFIGRRQQHVRCQVRTRISLAASHPAEEAGLAVFQNQDHHATLARTADHVVLTVREAGTNTRVAAAPVTADEVVLSVEADEAGYTFRLDGTSLGTIERSFFSTERAGGFVGVYLGLYATSNGRPSRGRAHVHWFSYQPR